MKFRESIFAVYGPVLLAALLIMMAAPACAMPNCGLESGRGASSPHVGQSQFKSACDLNGEHAPAGSSAPCHDGSCDDTVMSHGTPDATVVTAVDVPGATAVAQASRIPALVSLSMSRVSVAAPEPHPPDSLGVRLTV